MYWWLGITTMIIAALAYGYWDHTIQSRNLAEIFARLSAKYGGDVKGATVLILPQFRFELHDRRFLVTAMPTSGQGTAGTTGYTGPFTFVILELPFDTAQKIQIVRNAGIVDQVVATWSLKQVTVGDEDFDIAFRLRGSDSKFATILLDETVRQRLLNSHLPGLDIRVDSNKISVHMNGFAKTQFEIEELIEIAILIADRYPSGFVS